LAGNELTGHEVQILQLVAWGYRNWQMAEQLSMAGETVRMHLKNILWKLGARDRTHAVTIAVTRGVLRLSEEPFIAAWRYSAS
jgi:two-component system NarL family response regulator